MVVAAYALGCDVTSTVSSVLCGLDWPKNWSGLFECVMCLFQLLWRGQLLWWLKARRGQHILFLTCHV